MIGRNRYRLILVLNVLLPSALDLKSHNLSNDTTDKADIDIIMTDSECQGTMHSIDLNHVMG